LNLCSNISLDTDVNVNQSIYDCADSFIGTSFETFFTTTCSNKDSCAINFSSFFNKSSTDPICSTDPARYWVGYYCQLTDENFKINKKIGLAYFIGSFFVCALFLISLFIHRR
jgi:hypothetical protein